MKICRSQTDFHQWSMLKSLIIICEQARLARWFGEKIFNKKFIVVEDWWMTVVFTYHRDVPLDFRIRWFTLLDEKQGNRRTNQYPTSSHHSSLSRLQFFLCHVEDHRLGFLPRFISFLVQSSEFFFNLCDMQAADES